MEWYYAKEHNRVGPVTAEAFDELVRSGEIGESTLVWNVTMAEWAAFSSLRVSDAVPPPLEQAMQAASFCSNCGRPVASGADLVSIGGNLVCGFCKPALLQQMREGTAPLAGRVQYGGFWARFAATLIDSVIVGVANIAVSTLIIGFAAASGDPAAGLTAFALSYAVGVGIGVAYEGYFLVNKGATPGKMALGLKVINASGGLITWGMAIGRYFGKMVSGIIFGIGFLMAAWDPEKRALHDRMVNTRVVKA